MQQKKIKRLTACSINKVTWARKVNFGFVDHVCTCRSLIEMDNLQSYQINRADGTGGGQSVAIAPLPPRSDNPHILEKCKQKLAPSTDLLIMLSPRPSRFSDLLPSPLTITVPHTKFVPFLCFYFIVITTPNI